jgi:hypothetical protein
MGLKELQNCNLSSDLYKDIVVLTLVAREWRKLKYTRASHYRYVLVPSSGMRVQSELFCFPSARPFYLVEPALLQGPPSIYKPA